MRGTSSPTAPMVEQARFVRGRWAVCGLCLKRDSGEWRVSRLGLESCLVGRSRKTKARCFDPHRPVRRWPFLVCGELLKIFVHGTAGLDP
jgi:hypothetical protein